ncbi:pentatricopeptide repeat-containing protein At1g08070, chloroplastic-like [Phalaenopsis equestris]|uniref:pentatricopeptide repeat-containing protein At1g08070, chloroplastic-like n=1 Tax=Phalaenopsis equestris TaxID=78828 RepID=UPI0009E48CF3|nr:pentatricopeptide repeat-containing protein At1g08070, chloroplastic-like [Phalaenopsis equestris]
MNQLLQLQTLLITDPPPPSFLDPNLAAVKLISATSARSNPRHATLIFSVLPDPNLHVWNSLLKALADNHLYSLTLSHFNSLLLLRPHLLADEFTFTSILKSCAALISFADGEASHAFIISHGISSNIFVANSLVDMYFKFGRLDDARKLFDDMPVKDVVSWNTIISGYSSHGDVNGARQLFDRMSEKTSVTWSAMIAGHSRAGDVRAARYLFDEAPQKNTVCWNAMISGYAQNERFSDCLKLFRSMLLKSSGVQPNAATLVSVLSACAHLGALDSGQWIHKYIDRKHIDLSLFLGNSLADMYAKCGCIQDARKVFDQMREKDVISWSIIISGLAMFGHSDEAMSTFHEMLQRGIEPNEITFMGILSACTHSGLVDAGLEYFRLMRKEFVISPKVEHYGCMVDLLSRAGRLQEAENLIASMEVEPNVIVWGALLGGCRIHGDIERGEAVVCRILELDPEHSGSYVYLATVYASMGRLEEAAQCRLKMREQRVSKTPGCSWIEVDHSVHEFFMGDRSHAQTDEIYAKIGQLRKKMRLVGYVVNTSVVSQSIDEEEKEDAVLMHSEKLALAFGLISLKKGEIIRIVKNLRVCNDCHDAFKVISMIEERQIVLRDRSRFHQFKEGFCSRKDYW